MKFSIQNALSNINHLKKGKKMSDKITGGAAAGLHCTVEGNTINMDLFNSCVGVVPDAGSSLRFSYVKDGPKGANSLLLFSGGVPGTTYSVYVKGLENYCIETISGLDTTNAMPNPTENNYVTINIYECGSTSESCSLYQTLPYTDEDGVVVFKASELCQA